MEEVWEEEYTVIPEREAYCFDGRKAEVLRAFGNSDELYLREVEGYLSDYRTSVRMLEMNRYERDYFARIESEAITISEECEVYLKAKMYDIRSFVMSIHDCDEKLLLYYHYIHGENLMRCAELLGVSRATVYRLKKRALGTAARYYSALRKEAL